MPPSPRVFVFRPKADKERAATVARLDELRSLVNSLSDEEVPFRDRMDVLRKLSRRREALLTGSTFGAYTMISNLQVDRVWEAIERLPVSCRPRDVDRVFKKVLTNLVPGEGRVNLSRADLAAATGLTLPHVSAALSVLVRLGVLHREVSREEGLRGPGRASFFINPAVGWNGALELREAAASKRTPPLLQLMV